MSDTPKAAKSRGRPSLTLNKRLSKRLTSPHKRTTNTEKSHGTAISLDSNDGTPPPKKLNLDDSYDSPTNFESNHSPTMFLSQTFCPDSPEVGWQWTQEMENSAKAEKNSMLDSGNPSNASSTVSVKRMRRTQREQSQAYSNVTTKLSEQHKAEKVRAEAILRERLSKLEHQLKIASSTKPVQHGQKLVENTEKVENAKDTKNNEISVKPVGLLPVTTESDTMDMENFSDFDHIFDESLTLENTIIKTTAVAKPTVNERNDLDDFFNDSDTDSLLMAATQKVESALPKIKQPKATASMPAKISTIIVEKNPTTPKSTKDKRSSLYMKFLEDDEDDLFISLDDETVLKASQSQKPRSPFQRYKSMPAATTSTSTSASNSTVLSSSGTKMSEHPSWSLKNGAPHTATNKAPLKRHASSYAIATVKSSLPGLQCHKRQ